MSSITFRIDKNHRLYYLWKSLWLYYSLSHPLLRGGPVTCWRAALCPQDLASSLKIPFLETSAKSSDNVEKAFLTMGSEIHKRLASEGAGMQGEAPDSRGQGSKINSAPVWLGGDKQTQDTSNCCWGVDRCVILNQKEWQDVIFWYICWLR